jgi:CAAX protease family protein
MSLPSNLMPEPSEPQPEAPQSTPAVFRPIEPGWVTPLAPAISPSAEARFPSWSLWDVLAVLAFTVFAVFGFSVIALFIARSLPQYRHAPMSELATNALIVVGAQAAAYPIVLLFIFLIVRSRSREQFRKAIHWNWPGISAPAFFVLGIVTALVIEGLSRFLPIPKSLPMDKYFHDAGSAYLMAMFGMTLAPLLEELFFRGLLYPLLQRAFGLVIAVVLTATAFAGIHGTQLGYAWAPILSIFVVGVVFTVTRVRTNSVAASFLMHCGYNFALFGALWLASDHYRHLEKVTG